MSTNQDATEIHDILHSLQQAHARRDADAIVSLYENNAVIYDLAPPLGRKGISKETVQVWLDTWDGAITLDIESISLTSTPTIAFVSSLNRMRGSTSGKTQDLWFRATLCLRKG